MIRNPNHKKHTKILEFLLMIVLT